MSETKAGVVLLAVTSCLRASKAPDVKLGGGGVQVGRTNKQTKKEEKSTWGGEGEEVEKTRVEEGGEMGRGGEEGGEGFQHFHHRLAPATPVDEF